LLFLNTVCFLKPDKSMKTIENTKIKSTKKLSFLSFRS